MPDWLREAAFGVHARGETAGRDELINASARPLQETRVAPKLRRTPGHQRAAQTLRLFARLTVELPEHMRGTNQPVFVRRIEFHGAPHRRFYRQDLRAEQRDVMKMDHVIRLTVERFSDALRFQPG